MQSNNPGFSCHAYDVSFSCHLPQVSRFAFWLRLLRFEYPRLTALGLRVFEWLSFRFAFPLPASVCLSSVLAFLTLHMMPEALKGVKGNLKSLVPSSGIT